MKRDRPFSMKHSRRPGRRSWDAPLPADLSREAIDEALECLPDDVDPAELLEFLEESGDQPHADPVFRESLRHRLWGWLSGRTEAPVRVARGTD